MVIQGNAGITATQGLVRTYQPQTYTAPQTQKEDFARRFDSVTLSTNMESGLPGAPELELKSRLNQEIRAAAITPSETITSLREQIRNGTYRPDPSETARKMLLMGEAF